ncbi:hypothetical protein [Mesorhizobium sp.]|uniref:hypothetical protein n=1 Tax=Mesorhizobium sp. TaxID=1871066 RepID=UPI00257B23FF|nr:hypothetical protein [Mesorhizobium sp.]
MVDKVRRSYCTVGKNFPTNAIYQLFPEDIEQRYRRHTAILFPARSDCDPG